MAFQDAAKAGLKFGDEGGFFGFESYHPDFERKQISIQRKKRSRQKY
jgi:hypothetical protein